MHIMAVSDPLTLPTWLTAILTGVLAVGALVTAVFAFLAFRKQSQEVALLQEQDRRDIEQRRRAQAAQVFTWPGKAPLHGEDDMRDAVFIRNTSAQPVYDISIGWGGQADALLPVLMPGDEHAVRGAGTSAAKGTFAEFRDTAGAWWRTTSEGELTDLTDVYGAGPTIRPP